MSQLFENNYSELARKYKMLILIPLNKPKGHMKDLEEKRGKWLFIRRVWTFWNTTGSIVLEHNHSVSGWPVEHHRHNRLYLVLKSKLLAAKRNKKKFLFLEFRGFRVLGFTSADDLKVVLPETLPHMTLIHSHDWQNFTARNINKCQQKNPKGSHEKCSKPERTVFSRINSRRVSLSTSAPPRLGGSDCERGRGWQQWAMCRYAPREVMSRCGCQRWRVGSRGKKSDRSFRLRYHSSSAWTDDSRTRRVRVREGKGRTVGLSGGGGWRGGRERRIRTDTRTDGADVMGKKVQCTQQSLKQLRGGSLFSLYPSTNYPYHYGA